MTVSRQGLVGALEWPASSIPLSEMLRDLGPGKKAISTHHFRIDPCQWTSDWRTGAEESDDGQKTTLCLGRGDARIRRIVDRLENQAEGKTTATITRRALHFDIYH